MRRVFPSIGNPEDRPCVPLGISGASISTQEFYLGGYQTGRMGQALWIGNFPFCRVTELTGQFSPGAGIDGLGGIPENSLTRLRNPLLYNAITQ